MQRKYKIEFSSKASKDLEKFRKKYWKAYRDFLALVPALEADPFGVGQKLKGNLKGLYSLHFGRSPECRAIYQIHNEVITVIILRISTREDAY